MRLPRKINVGMYHLITQLFLMYQQTISRASMTHSNNGYCSENDVEPAMFSRTLLISMGRFPMCFYVTIHASLDVSIQFSGEPLGSTLQQYNPFVARMDISLAISTLSLINNPATRPLTHDNGSRCNPQPRYERLSDCHTVESFLFL
jgi:hypothetical protein